MTRQRENFLILMENMDTALQLQSAQLDSNGSALTRYGEYAKSTEAKLNDLTNAIQKIWLNLLSSEFINSAIEGMTSFVGSIGNVTESFGGLNTALYIVIATLAILKSQAIAGVVTSVAQWVIGFGLAETAALGLSMGIKALSTAMIGLATNPIVLAIVAISAITAGLVHYANSQEKLKKQLEETGNAQSEFNKYFDEFNSTLDIKKIDEMATALEKLKQSADYDKTIENIRKLEEEIKKLENNKSKPGVVTSAMDNQIAEKRKDIESLTASMKPYLDAQNKFNEAQRLATAIDYESVQAGNKKIALKIRENEINRQLINSYQKVYDKLAQGNKLTEEESKLNQKMIDKYPEYTKVLNDKTTAVGIDIKALQANQTAEEALAIVSFNAMKSKAESSAIATKQIIADTEARIHAIQAEINALQGKDEAMGSANANVQYHKLVEQGSAQTFLEFKNNTIFDDTITPKLKVDLSGAYNQLQMAKQTLGAWNTLSNMGIEDLRKGVSSGSSYNHLTDGGETEAEKKKRLAEEKAAKKLADAAEKLENVTGPFAEQIRESSKTNNVSATLIDAVIKQESNFKNTPATATSTSGARGLMQLMPGTQAELKVQDVWNPDQNIAGGSKYLADRIKDFGGDIQLGLAAYNAGAGKIASVLKATGGTTWDDIKDSNLLTDQTKNYVPTIYNDYLSRRTNNTALDEINNSNSAELETPTFTDITDAILSQNQAQITLNKTKSDTIKADIELAKSSNDYATALSKTNELIGSPDASKTLSNLLAERDKINSLKDQAIASSKFSNTELWFDSENNATDVYTSELSQQSEEAKAIMTQEFATMQDLRNRWVNNKKETDNLFVSPQEFEDAKKALLEINAQKDAIIKSSQFGDTSPWFDEMNNASQQYLTEFANQSGEVQNAMTAEFDIMQALRKGWVSETSLSDHLSISAKSLNDLTLAKDKINELKDVLIASSSDKFGDIGRWFNNDNEASTIFVNEKNNSTAVQQKAMDELFTVMQKLRKEYVNITTETKAFTEEQKKLQETMTLDLVNMQITQFSDSMDKLNSQLSLSKAKQSLLTESSSAYNQETSNQIQLQESLGQTMQDSLTYMQSQLTNDKLSTEAKANLTKQIEDQTIALLNSQNAIKELLTSDISTKHDKIIEDINKSLDSYSTKLDETLSKSEERIQKYNDKLSNIDYDMSLLQESDYTDKEDLLNDAIDASSDKANRLASEFKRLSNTTVYSKEDAKRLKQELQSLKDEMKSTNSQTIEYVKTLEQVQFAEITSEAKLAQDEIDRMTSRINSNRNLLEDGMLSGTSLSFDFSMPDGNTLDLSSITNDSLDNIEEIEVKVDNSLQNQLENAEEHYEEMMELINNFFEIMLNSNGDYNSDIEDGTGLSLSNQYSEYGTFYSNLSTLIESSMKDASEIQKGYLQEMLDNVSDFNDDLDDATTPTTKGNSNNGSSGSSSNSSRGKGTLVDSNGDGAIDYKEYENGERVYYSYDSFAKGTPNGGAEGGLSRTSELGRELIFNPDGTVELTSDNGPEFRNLKKGAHVIPNKETEELLKNRSYASGTEGYEKLFEVLANATVLSIDKVVRNYTSTIDKKANKNPDDYVIDSDENTSSDWVPMAKYENGKIVDFIENMSITQVDEILELVEKGYQFVDQDMVTLFTAGLTQAQTEATAIITRQSNEISDIISTGNQGYQETIDKVTTDISAFQATYAGLNATVEAKQAKGSGATEGEILNAVEARDTAVNNKSFEWNSQLLTAKADSARQTIVGLTEYMNNNDLTEEAQAQVKQAIQDQNDIIASSLEQRKQIVTEYFAYEQSLRDDSLQEISDSQDDIQYSKDMTDESDYSTQINLSEQLADKEKERLELLKAQQIKLIAQRDAYAVGSYEWNILNGQVKNYGELIEDSTLSVKENAEEVANIKFDSATKPFEEDQFGLDTKISYNEDLIDLYETQGKSQEEISALTKENLGYLDQKLTSEQAELASLEEYLKTQEEGTEGWKKTKDAIDDVRSSIIDTKSASAQIYKDIADDIIDAYKTAYKKQEEIALASIEKQKDAYNDMIDDQIKKLDDANTTTDYNEELTEMQSDAQKIQNQINSLSLDDSVEGQAKRIALEEELAEAKLAIARKQRGRDRELQKESLEEQKTNNNAIADQQKISTTAYYDGLINDDKHWAEVRETIYAGNFTAIQADFDKFDVYFKDQSKVTLDQLGISWQGLLTIIDQVKDAGDSLDSLPVASVVTPTVPADTTTDTPETPTNPTESPIDYSNSVKIGDEIFDTTDSSVTSAMNSAIASGIMPQKYVDGKWTDAFETKNDPNSLHVDDTTGKIVNFDPEERQDMVNWTWDQIDKNGKQPTIEEYMAEFGLKRFDTGGSTGNSEGLAWLDKKEQVLSDVQTVSWKKLVDNLPSLTSIMDKIMANVNPLQNILSNLKIPDYSSMLNQMPQQSMEFNFDSLINVQGNIDKDALPSMKDIATFTINELNKTFNRKGILR